MGLPGFTAETAVEDAEKPGPGGTAHAKWRIAVPGLSTGEVGLGDVFTRATSMVGMRPCGGCHRRAQALNSWVSFSPRR